MTTEELIERLNQNKRVRADNIDGIIILYNDSEHPLMSFNTQATNFLDFTFNDQLPSDSMGKASREYVAAQIEEYLQTPIEQRKSEKKYYLLARSGSIWPYMKARYVTRITTQVDSAAFDYGKNPTVFTEKELSTIKRIDPVLAPAIELMKVPVPAKEDD